MADEEEKKDANAPSEPHQSTEKKVGKFARGDHMVHIYIQKGKKFVPFIEDSQ